MTPLQQMAGAGAMGLSGQPRNFADASALTRGSLMTGGAGQAGAASSLPWIGQYMNPFTDSVVNNSLAGFDQNAARQVQQGRLDAQHGNIGSNAQVGDALLQGQQGLDRGQLESGLRSQGFNTAAGLADSQAGREQQSNLLNAQLAANYQRDAAAQKLAAGGQLANIGTMQDANTRANLGTQSDIGGLFQANNQAQIDAPFKQAGWTDQQIAGLPLGMFNGEHTVGTGTSKTSDPMGLITGLLGGAGSLMSGAGALGAAGGLSKIFGA